MYQRVLGRNSTARRFTLLRRMEQSGAYSRLSLVRTMPSQSKTPGIVFRALCQVQSPGSVATVSRRRQARRRRGDGFLVRHLVALGEQASERCTLCRRTTAARTLAASLVSPAERLAGERGCTHRRRYVDSI